MIERVMPYVNAATRLVPEFGQKEAVIFAGALIAESFVRCFQPKDPAIQMLFLDAIKHIQFYASFAKNPTYSYSIGNKLKAHLSLLSSNVIVVMLVCIFTGVKECDKRSYRNVYHANFEADRPPLASFVACAGEALKIGAKIVGSLATGIVVQKMVDGQTEGKVLFAVSAALLALSAWNLKAVVE